MYVHVHTVLQCVMLYIYLLSMTVLKQVSFYPLNQQC